MNMRFGAVAAALCLTLLLGCDNPYKEGREMLKNGEFEKAAAYFKDLAAKNPDDYRAHHELGYAYSRLRMYDQAVLEYQKALQLNPDNFATMLNLGTTYLIKMDHPRARVVLEKAVELNPESADAHANLAWAYMHMQELDKAEAEAKKAIELAGGENEYGRIIEVIEKKRAIIKDMVHKLENPPPKGAVPETAPGSTAEGR